MMDEDYKEPIFDPIVASGGDMSSMDVVFTEIARSGKKLTRLPKKEFDRQKVLMALDEAYELIGGTPRLAIWAHHNPDKFYALWGKTIPAAAQLQVSGQLGLQLLRPALPPSELDGNVQDIEFVEEPGAVDSNTT